MNRNSDVFSEEYAIEAGTDISGEPRQESFEEQNILEEEKYGISKPYRVIIRARVARDES